MVVGARHSGTTEPSYWQQKLPFENLLFFNLPTRESIVEARPAETVDSITAQI